MQQYLIYIFELTPMSDEKAEILTALLGEIGFDSFEQTERGVQAYIPETLEAEVATLIPSICDTLAGAEVSVTYRRERLELRDWNEQWENEGFQTIEIPSLCRISKPEEAHPEDGTFKYHIVLQPRMAFGSGTHDTTAQLVEILLQASLEGKRCLDMGTGTGILAICMALRGASPVMAIDIDEDSVENARHNCLLNQAAVQVCHGDASAIDGTFDLIVANIHRNIIVNDLPTYVSHLAEGGTFLCSGFYAEDVAAIEAAAQAEGLSLVHRQQRNEWVVLQFRR